MTGNLLNDGTQTSTYDALSRMLTTTNGSEQRVYTYNGDGTLVAQTANGTTTRFTQDLISPLSQILQTTQGTTTKHYVYGHEGLYKQAGIVRTWYGGDALGSVRQTLNEAGSPLVTLNYDPWGTPEGGATPPLFGFTGEWQDAGVGLLNLRARWSAPWPPARCFQCRGQYASSASDQHALAYSTLQPGRKQRCSPCTPRWCAA